jgi:hypothetical protein
MSQMPDGWFVDVDGDKVLVTIPAGDESGRRLLSRHEARVLRVQLHLAYLLAGGNFWTTGGGAAAPQEEPDSFSALIRDRLDLGRVEISAEKRAELLAKHRQRVERYREELERATAEQGVAAWSVDWGSPEWDVLARQARAADGGGSEDHGRLTGQLPEGWSIESAGPAVRFTVPASGVDGELELTDMEALSAGVRFIQLSAIARAARSAIEWLKDPSLESRERYRKFVDEFLDRIEDPSSGRHESEEPETGGSDEH